MHNALRERDFDVVLFQDVPDRKQHVALDIGDALGRIADPETEDKIQRGLAHCGKVHDGRRFGEDAAMFYQSGFDQ